MEPPDNRSYDGRAFPSQSGAAVMSRRPLLWFVFAGLALLPALTAAAEAVPAKPNILWITCEDMSPTLGCYGDTYAKSPTIDRLAAEGVRYTNCFTHIGVCAPSRSGLI